MYHLKSELLLYEKYRSSSLSKKSRPATAPLAQGWTKFFHLVAPADSNPVSAYPSLRAASCLSSGHSAHIGGFAPYNPRYIAKKCTAGERVEGAVAPSTISPSL